MCVNKNRLRSSLNASGFIDGAGDGIRTRDLHLGKVSLYQLSHSRSDD